MKALMFDGLELGKFNKTEDKLVLILNKNVQKLWLPYIFQLGYEADYDMDSVINEWKKERVFPRNRHQSFKMLRELGLYVYNVDKILALTHYSVITDPYWIAMEDTDTYSNSSVRGKLKSDDFPYNSMNLNEDEFIWRI